jgi:2-octaprenyl-3-methyl-6-methoxy-1,4-benzoquinol hydroxylase
MPAESRYDAVIAGAGVGGAALALALASQHQLRVLLLERRAGPNQVNRGDSLLPAITAHLARWGALERLRQAGAREVTRMEVHHHRAGLVFAAPLNPAGAPFPYLCLPHPAIEQALIESALATGRVELWSRTRVAGLLEEAGRVRGAALERDGVRCEVLARLVVGADGAQSVVRAALGVEMPAEPYAHGFFVVDLEARQPDVEVMRINLHPQGGVLVVPGPGRIGVAALVHPEQEALFRAGALEDKLAAIARRVPLCDGRAALPGAHLYKLHRGHAERYAARGAALLGDAAHVTNPTAGQGMTMAVEDAAALASHLGPPLASGAEGPGLDLALLAYEAQRRPANGRLIFRSHLMSRFYADGGSVGDEVRRRVFTLGGSPLGQAVHRAVWSRMAFREAR